MKKIRGVVNMNGIEVTSVIGFYKLNGGRVEELSINLLTDMFKHDLFLKESSQKIMLVHDNSGSACKGFWWAVALGLRLKLRTGMGSKRVRKMFSAINKKHDFLLDE